ncbi:MAG: porin family protein [Gammaproteobacteria bacterium]|nr:porin family protein [Gammaproteobacteria bacterium]
MKIARVKIATVVAATLIALCSSASATFYPNSFYFGFGVGGAEMDSDGNFTCDSGSCSGLSSSAQIKSNGAPGGTIHIGYALHWLPIQFELSYQYFYQFEYDEDNILQTGDKLESKVSNQSAFANVIVNANFNWPVIPYILAGYGANYSDVKSDYTADSSTTRTTKRNDELRAAWQAGAGFYYQITPNLMFNLVYKYQNLGKVTWRVNNNDVDTKFSSKNLTNNQGEIGLIYFIGDQHQPPSLVDE